MFRKVLLAGGTSLLFLSAYGSAAHAQDVARAPVPTTPTSEPVTSPTAVTTSTTQPATTVQRSTAGMAGTGPHDYVGWVSLGGVVSIALGISMRGRRAYGSHWR